MPSPAEYNPQVAAHADSSVVALLRQLMDQLRTLLRQEAALIRTEVLADFVRMMMGVGAAAVGGLLLFAALLLGLTAAVIGLSDLLPTWAAAVAVGGAIAIVGALLVHAGQRAIKSARLKPERSLQSLREDEDVILRRPL